MSEQRRFDRIMRLEVICSLLHAMSYRLREGYSHTPHPQPSYPTNSCSNLACHLHGIHMKNSEIDTQASSVSSLGGMMDEGH